MKLLTYDRPRLLSRLADELAALPDLAPVVAPDGRLIQAFKLSSGALPTSIVLYAPDHADEAAIQSVITAHDPTPPPPPIAPDYGTDAADPKQVAAAVTSMRAFVANPSPNSAQIVAHIKLLDAVVLAMLKRLV